MENVTTAAAVSFEGFAEIPPLRGQPDHQEEALTTDQALARLRQDRQLVLEARGEGELLAWVGLWNRKLRKGEKLQPHPRADTTAWLAPLVLQAQDDEADPTVRKKLRKQIKAQQKVWRTAIIRAYKQTAADVEAHAREAMEALGNDEARAEAIRLLDRAADEAWSHQEPQVTDPARKGTETTTQSHCADPGRLARRRKDTHSRPGRLVRRG